LNSINYEASYYEITFLSVTAALLHENIFSILF